MTEISVVLEESLMVDIEYLVLSDLRSFVLGWMPVIVVWLV